jgi:lysophospholipase L1-like esterase
VRYVALGSSFASGPGVEPVVDARCGRSGANYAHLLAARLGLDLVDVTCGGATVADLRSASQALMTGGTVPPQVDAVPPDAGLVTVTVGGNDVEYVLTLMRCSFRAYPGGAPAAAGPFFATPVDPAVIDRGLAALPASLAGLVGDVRERAPQARVVLVDYLPVVPDAAVAGLPMSDDDRAFCADLGRRLAAATAEAATLAGAELVAASVAGRDHAVGSAEPWVTGWVFSGDPLRGGVGPYHPNAAGMAAVADLLTDLLG